MLPASGILITFLIIKYMFRGRFDKGLGSIIYDISWNSGIVKKSKTFSHILTSGITVGLGGSAGLEAPIAVTGSAIGSNLARMFNLGYNERVILLACGAASGISAVFNSPIAGVVFALEVLLINFSTPVFIPLLIASASSAILSNLIYKGQLFYLVTTRWYFEAIPFYLLLGIVCGLLSVYMSRITLLVEGRLGKNNSILKPIFGGLLLGAIIFVFPPLYGEGYMSIEHLFKGEHATLLQNGLFEGYSGNASIVLIIVMAIILIKPFATALTIGSGGNGGIFAPSLFTGALTGFGLAFFVNSTGLMQLSTVNFIAVGMAGILSGVVRAPLTAIFLIAEVTGGYVLFVPLMLVSAISYFISRYLEPHSVYTKKLAMEGRLMTDDKDKNALNLLNLSDLIENDFIILNVDDKLSSLVAAFQKSNRNIFPVVDEQKNFQGIVYLEKVKENLFRPEHFETTPIRDIMDTNVPVIAINSKMAEVMEKFEDTNAWNMVVLDGTVYYGIISKSALISNYRRIIKRSGQLF